MNKNLSLFIIIILSLMIDILSKGHFAIFENSFKNSLIEFSFLPNYGVALGNLSEVSPLLRIVFVSTMFGLITSMYLFLFYYLWTDEKIYKFRLASTLIYTGIAGNSFDRIRLGYVIDFINLRFEPFKEYVFNFADIILLLGVISTIYYSFKLHDSLFYEKNFRKLKINYRPFQIPFLKMNMINCFITNFITAIFGYSLLVAVMPDIKNKNLILSYFVIGYFGIIVIQMVYLAIFSISYSNRISGPIKKLRSYIEKNSTEKFSLRKNDFHKEELEYLFKKLRKDRSDNNN